MPSTRHQGEVETKHDSGLWEGSSQLHGKGKEQQPARPPPPAHLSVLLCVLWKSVKLLLCLSVSVFPTLTPILSLCVCGGYVSMCMVGRYIYLFVYRCQRRASLSCSITFYLIPLRQDCSLNLELGWCSQHAPTILSLPPTTTPSADRHAAMSKFSYGCWGAYLNSSCLWQQAIYPLNHLPGPPGALSEQIHQVP